MADTDNKESEKPPIDVNPSALHQVEPTWRTDGYGIRGPQEERTVEKVGASPMNFESSYPHTSDGGGVESCIVPGGDTSKVYIKATHFTGGRWVCYWLETTQCIDI